MPERANQNAVLTAAGVAIVVVVFRLIGAVLGATQSALYGASLGELVGTGWLGASFADAFVHALVLGAAVLVVVRWVVPLPDGSVLRRILFAATVATLVAAIVFALFGVLEHLAGAFSTDQSFFGNSFPSLSTDLRSTVGIMLGSVISVPQSFLADAPIVALVMVIMVRLRGELRAR